MKVGTKSILFGVHCFAIHPVMIFIAWWRLYGFPFDPRLWVAFFVHDLGYWGQPNMDGPEGESHPYFGGKIMARLFGNDWYWFTILHSRYLAKRLQLKPSKLCIADKLVIAIEPSWLYLPRAILTGEINDYFEQAAKCDPWSNRDPAMRAALISVKRGGMTRNAWQWHQGIKAYMRLWVEKQIDTRDRQPEFVTSAVKGQLR